MQIVGMRADIEIHLSIAELQVLREALELAIQIKDTDVESMYNVQKYILLREDIDKIKEEFERICKKKY